MKTIPAGSFKARCLAIMDEVKAKRETVVITKHGEPVAKLVPVDRAADEIFGFFRGKGAITGDIVCSGLSPKEWGNLGYALANNVAAVTPPTATLLTCRCAA